MANGVPNLHELRVTLTGPRYGVYRVRYEMLDFGPYPPPPRVEDDTVSFADDVQRLEMAQAEIQADVLDAAALPPALGDLSGLWDLDPLEGMREQWPWEVVAERMEGVIGHLFQGEGEAMLHRLLAQTTPPYDTIYGPPRGLWTVGRIALNIESPTLQRVPWEVMTLGEPDHEGLWERCIVLRRSSALAGESSGPFDIPVSVAIRLATDAVLPQTGWSDNLFDGFTHGARDMGGIEWNETLDDPETGEIHHVVYNSAEGLTRVLTALGHRRRRRRMRGGRALSAGPIQPRLLVLHDVSAHIPAYLITHVVYESLARGADAVLLAAFETADPGAGGFFPTFYRKLMHNWPLDHCLLAALAEAASNGALPQGWAFGAREGGELRLLLTRAAVEAAQAEPEPAAAKDALPEPRRGRVTRGRRPAPAPPGGGPPLPPMGQPGPSVAPTARQARAAADLEAQARQAVESQQQAMIAEVASMASVSFDAEFAGVAQIVSARERMREAARAAAQGEEALEMLARSEVSAEQSRMVRLTNLWLTEGVSGVGRAVTDQEALTLGDDYTLHLQIALHRLEVALAAAVFPDEALHEVFERHEKVQLDVMFFSPATDFELGRQRAILELPRHGPSNEVQVKIRPLGLGERRLRVCIYYRNVLLQSVLLEATVTQHGVVAPAGAIVARMVDYVASIDLALLEDLPQPALNIFTNEISDGTHWVGVFAPEDLSDDESDLQLRAGDTHTFDPTRLASMTENARELLARIEGKNTYRFTAPLPLDERQLKRREKDLVQLAVRGWTLYHSLFRIGMERARMKNLHSALQRSGIVSVARCRGGSTTIPWAALYDLSLDTGKEDEITLCEIFKAQLAVNRWSEDTTELKEKHDLLDDPETCRNDPQCPLKGAKRRLTVCPFGFWGFLHQVEQPLQQVTPTSVDQVPDEMKQDTFNQTSWLMHSRDEKVQVAISVWPAMPGVQDHHTEIKGLSPPDSLTVVYEEDRDQVLGLLYQGGKHLYYFFCHGEIKDDIFKLKLGPIRKPGYISAADLDPFEIEWPEQVQPLVILNGCETMALLPERIHDFLETLRSLGACGVVGTEIEVFTGLARPFGYQLLKHFLEGRSVGEAFLEARRHLLRQYNPLGLVYAYYAPATLHLHDPDDCGWCEKHSAVRGQLDIVT